MKAGQPPARGPSLPPSRHSALGAGAEFDRIRRIIARLGPAGGAIGDDCAVIPDGPGRLVASCDLSVEDVHFRTDWLSLEEIGWRAAAGALSDLAAGGARAVGVLVSLGVPPRAGEDDPAEVMSGVGAAVASVGGLVLGGDLSRAGSWLVDLMVLGRAERPVSRVGAAPGEGVWLTGGLGGARAALSAWLRGATPAPAARAAFAHPVPRLAAGRALAAAGATAMLDLSDGLGGDAAHLAAASACALEIDLTLLPLHPDVLEAARLEGLAPARFAAQGGEDYELLATMPASFGSAAAARIADETGVALTRVGMVVAGSGARFLLAGEEVPLRGFDHFA
jgi:thiamine-monophosphate kinase